MKTFLLLLITIATAITFALTSAKGVDSDMFTFTPTDSSPNASLFHQWIPLWSETFWEQALPLVSRDFYIVNAQPATAISKELITWGDLATCFTSISVAGGEEAQRFLNKINEEVIPFISRQADGTYVAEEDEEYQPAQLAASSAIFNKYAAWREGHYQLYKMLRTQKESGSFKIDLLQEQINKLGIENEETSNSSNATYRLASQQELMEWQARKNEAMEPLLSGKTYGLLMINVENMQSFAKEERAKEVLEPGKNQGSSLNKSSSWWNEVVNFVGDHPFTTLGIALCGAGVIVLGACALGIGGSVEAGVALITFGIASAYLGFLGFTIRRAFKFLEWL